MTGFNKSDGNGNCFSLWGKFSFVLTLCGISLVMYKLVEDTVEAAKHFLSASAWDHFLSHTFFLSSCRGVPDHCIWTRWEQILYHLRRIRVYQKINIKRIHKLCKHCMSNTWYLYSSSFLPKGPRAFYSLIWHWNAATSGVEASSHSASGTVPYLSKINAQKKDHLLACQSICR